MAWWLLDRLLGRKEAFAAVRSAHDASSKGISASQEKPSIHHDDDDAIDPDLRELGAYVLHEGTKLQG